MSVYVISTKLILIQLLNRMSKKIEIKISGVITQKVNLRREKEVNIFKFEPNLCIYDLPSEL